MKERPIIFSGPMVKAILEGRKTQTRRLLKREVSGRVREIGGHRNWHIDDPNAILACPYGRPGDRLWVRETWATMDQAGDSSEDAYPVYRATDPDWEVMDGWRWRPAIHMPRWASRLTLEITGVRVERLQEITEEDAIAEGVDAIPVGTIKRNGTLTHRDDFAQIWQTINGKRAPWESNPWVWVIEFKRVNI